MNRIRILPVAVATAMFVAGGATYAFADPNSHEPDFTPPPYGAQPAAQTPASSTTQPAAAWTSNKVSMSQAEKLAVERVGGTVVNTRAFGWGDHMYKIDLKNGNQMKRVYVNGKTGRLTVAINTAPGFDPSVIGGNVRDKDYLANQAG